MKVCLLSTSFPVSPGLVSGIFIQHLAIHLSNSCKVTVVAPDCADANRVSRGNIYNLVVFSYAPQRWQCLAHTEGGIPAALKRDWFSCLLIPSFLFSMLGATFVQARKNDVIHANWSICGAIAGIAGRLLGVPVLTTIRGTDLARAETSWIDRQILRIAIATNRAVVTVSHSQRKKLLAVAPHAREKLHTVLNGVGDDFYAIGRLRRPRRIPNRLLTVGRLIKGKGIDTILQALKLADNGEFSLTVVGSGPEEVSLKQLSQLLEVDHRVRFTGSIAHQRLPEVFREHDIFVLASEAEGRPNVVLESMATCTPVICTQIPAVDGLVEPGVSGRTFPVGDAASLAGQLQAAWMHPRETHNMARKAMTALISGAHTWDRCASEYLGLYRDLVERE